MLEHPARIAWLLDDAEALGVSDLFVQVYRGGRSWFVTKRADATPHQRTLDAHGRDGLTRLLDAATRRGLRVHAWVNVLSLARNKDAPLLRALGRDAVLVDNFGRSLLDYPKLEVPPPDRDAFRMGTPAVWLDPAEPMLRAQLAALFAELLVRYPKLAGLHFDYIRYADALPLMPAARNRDALTFGFGAKTRARFLRETGLRAPFRTSQKNTAAFDDWRRAQLSKLVAQLAASARAVRPKLEVSAAVIPDRARAYNVDFQDWLGWLDAGHLDFAVPMLYTRDAQRFHDGVETLAQLRKGGGRALWVGLGAWLFAREPADGVQQLRLVSARPALGSAIFSWDSLRETPALLNALAREAQTLASASPSSATTRNVESARDRVTGAR